MARHLLTVILAIILLEWSQATQQPGLLPDWLLREQLQQAPAKPLTYSEERQTLEVCLQEVQDRNCQCTDLVAGTGHCMSMYVE